MPDKKGRFTDQEKRFVANMAVTGDRVAASRAAGYKSAGSATQLMTRPAVQQAIRDAELAVLHNELLPLSNQVLRAALTDKLVPWGAKIKAVDIVQKRVFGENADKSGKSPAEMSPDELAEALERLKRELSERAVTIVEAEPLDPGEESVFG